MDVSPYLNFNGNCAEAFTRYKEVLGGELVMHTHGKSPMKDQVPAGWQDKVMHARLLVDGKALMGSDAPPTHYTPPQGTQVSISVTAPAEGERIFNALAEQGKVIMPFQKTFWASGFGMLVDRFGTPWMVNCEETV